MRFDVQLKAGLNDGEGNRVMAAAGAEGGDRPLIIAMGEAKLVHGNGGMAQFGLGDIGHSAASLEMSDSRSAIVAMMKRAGSMPHSLTSSERIWASRFCSTRKIWSWALTKSVTASEKGNARSRM